MNYVVSWLRYKLDKPTHAPIDNVIHVHCNHVHDYVLFVFNMGRRNVSNTFNFNFLQNVIRVVYAELVAGASLLNWSLRLYD